MSKQTEIDARERLLERIKNARRYWGESPNANQIADLVEELVAEYHIPKWVKIESAEDLPKESSEYWVTRRSDGLLTQRGYDFANAGLWAEYYTAWMPIERPQPYQPEDQ